MARVTFNSLFESLLGRLDGLFSPRLFLSGPAAREVTGRKSIISGAVAGRSSIRSRAKYAAWACREYPVYAELAAGRPMVSAYNVALSDCFHPPVIHRILCKDGRILVQASDNVLVTEVKVTVRDEQGNLLDIGSAARLEGDWWEYIPRTQGPKITAQAWDIPGNRAQLDLE